MPSGTAYDVSTFLLFLPSSLLVLLSILAKHKQMGISVIFRNIGVNLAFKLHKHLENML